MVIEQNEVDEEELVDIGLNVYTFKQASIFQSSVIAFLVGLKSNKEDLAALAKIFKKLDTSHDGYLQPEEIIEGFQKVNCGFISSYGKDPDWKSVISAIDTNGDGHIDYDEFMTAAANRAKLLNNENLKAAFKVLDANGDGTITADEL